MALYSGEEVHRFLQSNAWYYPQRILDIAQGRTEGMPGQKGDAEEIVHLVTQRDMLRPGSDRRNVTIQLTEHLTNYVNAYGTT